MIEPPVDTCDLLCLDLPHAERIRASLTLTAPIDTAAAAARSLGDPTRLTIATALAVGHELCVCDMAWVVGQAQNLVSHHLRQLKSVDLVTSRRQGRLVMYSLTTRGAALVEAITTATPPRDATSSPEHTVDHV